jgi:DNA-binding protein WhiA
MSMSFSTETKTELCRVPSGRGCCERAEAYGALLYGNTFTAREIRFITGSAAFAGRLPRLFRRVFGLGFDLVTPEGGAGKQTLLITDSEKIRRIFAGYGLEAACTLVHHINLGVLEEDCCRASFLRGAFLAGGSITDPEKRYHMEFVTDHMSVSRETYSLLLEMGFSPKDTRRGGGWVTYFKQSEAIEDLLTTMGAPLAAMGVMQAKVEKDMRNAVNRRVNCDSANADKIVSAAQQQLEAIRRLDRELGLAELPEPLQEAALLRIANPESSLAELALLTRPQVSKSCMSHRMKKILSYLEEE